MEFEKKILSGGIFFKNWGQWGKCVSGILKKILTGGIFFKIGGNGTNVLVEFEKNFNWGHFF